MSRRVVVVVVHVQRIGIIVRTEDMARIKTQLIESRTYNGFCGGQLRIDTTYTRGIYTRIVGRWNALRICIKGYSLNARYFIN